MLSEIKGQNEDLPNTHLHEGILHQNNKKEKKEGSFAEERKKRERKFHHSCYRFACRRCWPSNGSPVTGTGTTQWFASSSSLFLALNVTAHRRIEVPEMVRFGLLEVFGNGEVMFWFGTIMMKVSMDVETDLGELQRVKVQCEIVELMVDGCCLQYLMVGKVLDLCGLKLDVDKAFKRLSRRFAGCIMEEYMQAISVGVANLLQELRDKKKEHLDKVKDSNEVPVGNVGGDGGQLALST
ncbi:hypothetical protein V6N12_065011 [Hibiscus sabdariffa]|uniref:Uncharacterized protein n=1 Tax=Hibiscus sabdariffa TaxID=183260 RepID=A0ABR2G8D9_9ROSI